MDWEGYAKAGVKVCQELNEEINQLKELIKELKPDCCYQEYNDDLEQCLEPIYTKCKSCDMGKRVRNALNANQQTKKAEP